MKINILAEEFIGQANGVYTAVLEAVDALKKEPDVEVVLNQDWRDASLVHAHSIGLAYLWKSLFFKHKLIVSAHVVPDSFIGSLVLSQYWRPIAKWYLKTVFNRARLVVAVSPVVKEELEKIGVKTDIRVLCNSVDREKFKPDVAERLRLRQKWRIAEDAFTVLCVGQIQPRKGIYDFLDAARQCPDIQFVWVGGRPFGRLTADYDKLTKAVDEAPKNVLFTDVIPFDEMPAYYAMADVYFMPSYQENFAFATIEAASVKLPLVLRDNIEYPGTLFDHYLKAKDADGFAVIIQKLHQDRTYFTERQASSDTLASKYDLTSYMRQMMAIYHEVFTELN